MLRKLTKADVIEYFDKHFAVKSSERRKLCTMVYANTDTEETVSKRECDGSGDTKQVSLTSYTCVYSRRFKTKAEEIQFIVFSARIFYPNLLLIILQIVLER